MTPNPAQPHEPLADTTVEHAAGSDAGGASGPVSGPEPELEPETDPGPPRAGGKNVRDPERRCIVTMVRRPQTEMIRFVLSPDNEVTPDIDGRLPGRGAWVTASAENLGAALKRGSFARAFKSPAKANPALPGQVETLLAKRVLDLLGLARGAGQVIAGYEQVRDALKSDQVACLIEASDGSNDGRRKLASLSFAVSRGHGGAEGQEMLAIGCFTADELGMALGRPRVVHACLKQGPFARKWIGEVSRLAGFRPIRPAVWSTGPSGGRGGKDSEDPDGKEQGPD